jgi:hypothetical protein
MTDCKTGIAVAGDHLEVVDVDGTEMVMSSDTPPLDPASSDDSWRALPGFDEYLLGYKDRSMMATPEQLAAIIPGGNGVFQSTLVRGGKVMATWKRTIDRKGVTVTVQPSAKFSSRDRHNASDALGLYAAYLGLPLTVKNPWYLRM